MCVDTIQIFSFKNQITVIWTWSAQHRTLALDEQALDKENGRRSNVAILVVL